MERKKGKGKDSSRTRNPSTSTLQRIHKQPPHPLQQQHQIPRLIRPLHHRLNFLPFQTRLRPHNLKPNNRRRINLKPPLPPLTPQLPETKPQPLSPTLTSALYPQPETVFPELQLRQVVPGLRVERALMRRLRFPALTDRGLRRGDFGLQGGAVVFVGLLLRGQGRDRGVHFGGFGGFFLQGFGVGGAEGGEGGDLGEVMAVGFCEGGDMLASHFFFVVPVYSVDWRVGWAYLRALRRSCERRCALRARVCGRAR